MVTAVEFLEKEIFKKYHFLLQKLNCEPLEKAIEQAKEMEKEQIFESWDSGFDNGNYYGKYNENCEINCGEQYYNETFNLLQQDKP